MAGESLSNLWLVLGGRLFVTIPAIHAALIWLWFTNVLYAACWKPNLNYPAFGCGSGFPRSLSHFRGRERALQRANQCLKRVRLRSDSYRGCALVALFVGLPGDFRPLACTQRSISQNCAGENPRPSQEAATGHASQLWGCSLSQIDGPGSEAPPYARQSADFRGERPSVSSRCGIHTRWIWIWPMAVLDDMHALCLRKFRSGESRDFRQL